MLTCLFEARLGEYRTVNDFTQLQCHVSRQLCMALTKLNTLIFFLICILSLHNIRVWWNLSTFYYDKKNEHSFPSSFIFFLFNINVFFFNNILTETIMQGLNKLIYCLPKVNNLSTWMSFIQRACSLDLFLTNPWV